MQVRAMMLRLGPGIALIAASAVAIAQDSPAAQEQRRILNEAEANRGAAQIAEQEARQKAAAEQQAARDADYRAAMERQRARMAEMDAQARAQSEADASRCRAGDRTRCAPVTLPSPTPRETPAR